MLMESKTIGTENRFAEAGEGQHSGSLWGVGIALGPVGDGVSKSLCMH